jgi:hypothetical protein
MELYDAGRFAEAIEQFERADAIYPTPQYRVYIARAHVRLGRVATAARVYEKAVAMPLPPGNPEVFRAAQATAAEELEALRGRIPAIRIGVVGPPRGAATVMVDGNLIDVSQWGRVELDPGTHTLVASAPGFDPQRRAVDVREGPVQAVDLELQSALYDRPRDLGAKASRVSGSGSPAGPRDRVGPEELGLEELSHRGRIGFGVRVDVDPVNAGAVAALGASYGVFDWLELGASGLFGERQGFEPQATVLFMSGPWKPLLNVGAPIFFVDGARVGARGSVGLQLDWSSYWGVFIQVGAAYFGSVPDGYADWVVLPSAGAQARLQL